MPNEMIRDCARMSLAGALLSHFALDYRYNLDEYGAPWGHYANLWVCSASLILASGGMVVAGSGGSARGPDFVAFAAVAVAAGQVAWIVDTLAMLLKGERDLGPLGVASYGSIRDFDGDGDGVHSGRWLPILTASHHLWFMPAIVCYLRFVPGFRLTQIHFSGGALWVLLLSGVTLTMLPKECAPVILSNGAKICIMPNVNMKDGWWGAETSSLLHAFDPSRGHRSFVFYVYANAIYSVLMNGPCYFCLKVLVNKNRKDVFK